MTTQMSTELLRITEAELAYHQGMAAHLSQLVAVLRSATPPPAATPTTAAAAAAAAPGGHAAPHTEPPLLQEEDEVVLTAAMAPPDEVYEETEDGQITAAQSQAGGPKAARAGRDDEIVD